ncbi:SRPBCC family protein [Nocardia alni]|uniref:SRPBCC family protein n=1 Tax=Nocardia alni TaxID=2815723 RepID=UPI001C22ACCA|nr:SRPBCC family protein [Nocardia alni]
MRTVKLQRTICAPAADVFEWLTDVTNFQRVPGILRVTLVRPGDITEHGTGAVRLLVTPLARVTQEIVEYDPPRLIRYKMLKSSPSVWQQEGTLRFEQVEEGTRVTWISVFGIATPIFGDLWTLAAAPMTVIGLRAILATADRELRGE